MMKAKRASLAFIEISPERAGRKQQDTFRDTSKVKIIIVANELCTKDGKAAELVPGGIMLGQFH